MIRVIAPDDAPPRRSPSRPGQRVRVLVSRAPGLPAGPAVVEIEIAPGAVLPPRMDEHAEALVYVVSGDAVFACAGREDAVPPGGLVHVPAGAEVTFRNVGANALRLLVVLTPGGFERRFLAWEPVPPARDHGA